MDHEFSSIMLQAWHGRQRQRATRAEKLRFQALKADDQEAYMRMVKESKKHKKECKNSNIHLAEVLEREAGLRGGNKFLKYENFPKLKDDIKSNIQVSL